MEGGDSSPKNGFRKMDSSFSGKQPSFQHFLFEKVKFSDPFTFLVNPSREDSKNYFQC
jgi:hypothetical protein